MFKIIAFGYIASRKLAEFSLFRFLSERYYWYEFSRDFSSDEKSAFQMD